MKNVIITFILFCTTLSFAQKTISLTPVADDGISFHDGASSASHNYGNSLWNIAHSQLINTGNGINTGRTLIKFDFSSLPKNAILKKALLSMYAYPGQAGPTYYGHDKTNGSNTSYLRTITEPWTSNVVTWDTRPNSTSKNQVVLAESTSQFQDYKDIDVSILALEMIKNASTNYGFEFRLIDEKPTSALIFCSTNYSDKSKHPTLTVFYEEDSTVIITNPTTNTNNNTTTKDTICESQERFFVPNSFSPNEDGINDYFTIYASKNFTINYFRIFDRWGNLIFEKENFLCNDDAQGWNGNFRDKKANQGTYTCIAKITDDKKCTKMIKSSIDLLR